MSETNSGRNHALWATPLLAVVGFLSYYAFFAQYPLFRDHPWFNLLLLALAIGLGVVGLRRAWPGGALRRAAALASLALAVGLFALLLFYSYSLSYDLPSAELAAKRGEGVPAVALASSSGGEFDLGAAARGSLVLVFYRGYW